MVYKYESNAMRKGSSFCHILVFSSQPTQRAECVCEQRSSALLLPWGEERERKVSRLLTWPLGCRGQHAASEPYGVVPAQRLNDGWRRLPGVQCRRQGEGCLGGCDQDGAGDELAGLAAAHSHQLWRVGGADEVAAQGSFF